MSKLNLNPMADWGYVNNSRFRFLSIRNQGGGVEPVPPTPTIKGWYGVEVDESNTDPATAVKRIASDMTLHASLPIQSGMRRCMLNSDGTVNYYLDANDSTKKEDGTAAVLDGTDGDVMVEIPEHWVLVIKQDSTLTIRLAMEEGILDEGAQHVPLHYISAYQATVKNDTMHSASGVGATGNLDIGEFRTLAIAKGDGWSQMTYDYAVDLYWLFLVEYANRNSQAVVNNELTPEGYRQGGLGMGCTYVDGITDWPAVTNGATNSLGNNSGEISDVIPLSGSGKAAVNTYRGIENPFGNLLTFYDGIVNIHGKIYRAANVANYKSFFYEETATTSSDYADGEVVVTPDGEDGYLYYLCVAPSITGDMLTDDTKFKSTDMVELGYTLDAKYAETVEASPMLSINMSSSPLGSLLPESSNDDFDYTEGYCDESIISANTLRSFCGGGFAGESADEALCSGLACINYHTRSFYDALGSIGARLCYTAADKK